MSIQWINERYPEGNRIFDSMREAEEWADSLFSDFAGSMESNVGYATPDRKVFDFLSEFLPKWARYNHSDITIHTDIEQFDQKPLYKIWVTLKEPTPGT